MRRLTVLGTAALMTSASACTAHEVPTQNDVGFLCSVDGAKLLKPAMSDEVVCEAFKAKLDDVFAQKLIAIDSVLNAGNADWLKLNVRFSTPGSASVRIVQNANGKETTYPELGVDIMDRTMGPNDVGTLATEVTKLFAALKKE